MLGIKPVSTVPTKKASTSSLNSVVKLESRDPKSPRNLADCKEFLERKFLYVSINPDTVHDKT